MNSDKLLSITVTFKNTEATDALTTYAKEKVSHALQKFVRKDTEAHVILRVEKHRHLAEVNTSINGHQINATQESEDMYKSIDAVVDTLTQQLRKVKEKTTDHHAR